MIDKLRKMTIHERGNAIRLFPFESGKNTTRLRGVEYVPKYTSIESKDMVRTHLYKMVEGVLGNI